MRFFTFVAFTIAAMSTQVHAINIDQVDKSHINFANSLASVQEGGSQYRSSDDKPAPKKAARNSVDKSHIDVQGAIKKLDSHGNWHDLYQRQERITGREWAEQ